MTTPLFRAPATPQRLTPRQQQAWDYIRGVHGGITADELGAHLHSLRTVRPHSSDVRCEWCARAGREVATSAALKPFVVYRRGLGKYEPRDPAHRAAAPDGVQVSALPGESFTDIFNGSEAA